MKNIFLAAALLLTSVGLVNAQNNNAGSRYTTEMEKNLAILDTASTIPTWTELSNNFTRIGAVEKTKWEPNYYIAYCYTVMAANTPDKSKADILADKAELYLTKADSLQKNNAEISALFALVRAIQLSLDPMGRYQTLIPEVENYVNMAKAQDVNNPRAYLVEGRFKLRLPEMMGGGKDQARSIIKEALEKFKTFQPANSLAPRWGEQSAKQMMEKINQPG